MMKIYKYGEVPMSELLIRTIEKSGIEDKVRDIIDNVAKRGDEALREYSERFDNVKIDNFEVSQSEINEAYNSVDREFIRVLEFAASNIREYHEKQIRSGYRIDKADGSYLGMKITPIEKVGICVPGKSAAFPSTVLMNVIPAKLAGCGEIVMISPPGAGGKQPAAMLAAAEIAGADRIFRVGGAHGVAALAYGTESIPKVDKIVGPGNAFVAEAKRQVFGRVAIDMIAGPSEVLVIADDTNDPVVVAADLLSQAEHDVLATAVLITDSENLAFAVQKEVERQLALLPREDVARASIENNGKIIITQDLRTAVSAANELAPEHLELCVEDPLPLLNLVKNAGSVFLGKYSPEPLGDYLSGTNHTLPTCGCAKFSSALGVDDFVKKVQYSYYTKDALERVSEDVALFARQEGLEAHARSALVRFKPEVVK